MKEISPQLQNQIAQYQQLQQQLQLLASQRLQLEAKLREVESTLEELGKLAPDTRISSRRSRARSAARRPAERGCCGHTPSGFTVRNVAKIARSYMIFSPPPMKNETERPSAETMEPAEKGPAACEMFRAVFVVAFAAVRSSRETIPARYAWRVGASLWEGAIRPRCAASASENVGASGTAIRRTFDGMWVKTIVSRSPNRSPGRAATRKENAESTPAAKKMRPRPARGSGR